jgi:hypothetical protein
MLKFQANFGIASASFVEDFFFRRAQGGEARR